MRRLARTLPIVLVVGAACAPDARGPASPLAMEQVAPAPALNASAARQTVVEFVDAYAASPTEGVGALSQLVAGAELASWVRWLDVQHREFTGAIDAFADVRDVEFIGSVEARRTTLAQVGLSASVTFLFEPTDSEAFERARILDGVVTLVQGDPGAYKVVDVQRDGVLMSAGIQLFSDEVRSDGDVTVRLESLFMFPPNWQFNVVVANGGADPIVLDRDTAGLYVEAGDDFERLEPVFTGSLRSVAPGDEVDGILAFPLQETGQDRVLALAYRSGDDVLRFQFPLDHLVNVVPPPPPSGDSPAPDVTT